MEILSPEIQSVVSNWGLTNLFKYSDILFGIFIGTLLFLIYHKLIGDRAVRKAHKIIVEAKDESITSYKLLISERLDNIKPVEGDKIFFKKIKHFFNKV